MNPSETVPLDPRLESLLRAEDRAVGKAALDALARDYDALVEEDPRSSAALVLRNLFRLRHPGVGDQDRPKVLIGGMNDSHFPNFHSLPLLRVADVVSLTTRPDEGRLDRVSYHLTGERFTDVLARLPAGFAPDFFYDNNILGSHFLPIGLEDAPFPTVGGICHFFHSARNRFVAECFDVLLPVSRNFVEPLRAATGKRVLDIPFGLNWGSFHHVLEPGEEKDIDVSCTLAPVRTLAGASPARYRLHERMRELERAHGSRFRFHITHGIPRDEYLDVLRRSRISVNLSNFHGPYNYRTCEIMNSGAMVLHVEHPDRFAIETELGSYFEDGREVVLTDWEHLEEKLLYALEHPEESAEIARAGRERLEREYSYEALYGQLFRQVLGWEPPRDRRPDRARSLFALGATYWSYEDDTFSRLGLLALPGILAQPLEARTANLLALLPRLIAWHGLETVGRLLGAEQDVVRAFSQGTWAGIEALHRTLPGNPVASWNRAMYAIELGVATAAMMQEALALLGEDGPSFEPGELLLVRPRAPYLSESEFGQVHFGLFHHRVLAAAGDRARVLRVHREAMRWHCLRWLAEHEPGAGWLEDCLALQPRDSVLQCRLAERLRASDPDAARRAFERALDADPGCEPAREALSAAVAA